MQKGFKTEMNLENCVGEVEDHKPMVCHLDCNTMMVSNSEAHTCKVECDFCNKVLTLNSETHICELEFKPIVCHYCNKVFTTNGDLDGHECVSKGNRYLCKLCNQCFISSLERERHACTKGFVRKEMENVCVNVELLKCQICGQSFATKSALIVHSKSHSGHCYRGLSSLQFLKLHILRRHANSRMYTNETDGQHHCLLCSYKCADVSELKKHVDIHKSGKVVDTTPILIKHMKTKLSDDKLFACQVCDKRFSRLCNLKTHCLTHEYGKGRFKCLTCPVCPYTCATISDLNKHIGMYKRNNPFICSYCDKKYTLEEELKQHMDIHTGTFIFPCCKCPMTFSESSRLEAHLRTHAGEKPNKSLEDQEDTKELPILQVYQPTSRPILEQKLNVKLEPTATKVKENTSTVATSFYHTDKVLPLKATAQKLKPTAAKVIKLNPTTAKVLIQNPTASEVQELKPRAVTVQQLKPRAVKILQINHTSKVLKQKPEAVKVLKQKPEAATVEQFKPLAAKVLKLNSSVSKVQQLRPTTSNEQELNSTASKAQKLKRTASKIQKLQPTAAKVLDLNATASKGHQLTPTVVKFLKRKPKAQVIYLDHPSVEVIKLKLPQ